MPYCTMLRPIDICDHCDGLFPLESITPTIKVLKFKKIWVRNGVYTRLHYECIAPYEEAQKLLDI